MSDFDPDAARARLRAAMRAVPDFPRPGILFRDMTPILADPMALADAVELHRRAAVEYGPLDAIVAIEARGFVFGAILAAQLRCAFVPVRKPNKLPHRTLRETYTLEYGEDALEIHADALPRGSAALVVDDLLATGGTARAAATLVERLGARVAGFVFLVELPALGGRDALSPRPVRSILAYD
jgi:adenine phosphoribosyltransferase